MSTFDELDHLSDEQVLAYIARAVEQILPSVALGGHHVILPKPAEEDSAGTRAWRKTAQTAVPDPTLKTALYAVEVDAQREQLVQLIDHVQTILYEVAGEFGQLKQFVETGTDEIPGNSTARRIVPVTWSEVITRLEDLALRTKEPVIAAALALQGAYRAGWVARACARWTKQLTAMQQEDLEATAQQCAKDQHFLEAMDSLGSPAGSTRRLTEQLQKGEKIARQTWETYEGETTQLRIATFRVVIVPLLAGLKQTLGLLTARFAEAEQEIAEALSGKKPIVHGLRGTWMAYNMLTGVTATCRVAWELALRSAHELVKR